MTKRLAPVLLSLALALAVPACGGDDGDEEAAPPPKAPADTGGAAGGGRTVEVDMKDIKFIPADVTVQSGGKIVWTNSDPFEHTVTKQSGPGRQFDSGEVAAGKKYEQTFTAPGKIGYFCKIHPQQKGTITVE